MERNIVHPEVQAYLETLLPQAEPVRAEMERLAEERNFPIVGPLVGRLLFVLARGIGARRVFELGSGFGYSAFWFAQAVGPAGRVFCTDRSDQHASEAKDLLARAGMGERLEFHSGDALSVFAKHPGPFDIVFCDIDKEGYPDVPAAALPKLRQGGLLIFDNTLWFGRVVDRAQDKATAAIQRLNLELGGRPDLATTIVPLRDGVSVSLKL